MTPDDLESPAYDDLERGTLELHQMIRQGQGDTIEADGLREWMCGPWDRVTDAQREFADNLSGDLYMLNPDAGEMYDPVPDEERSPQRLGLSIALAQQRHDWAGLLDLLRRGPTFVTPQWVAYWRAYAYDQLGRPAVALAFVRFARELDPADVDTRLLEFAILGRATSPEQVDAAAWAYVDAGHPPRMAVVAAGHLFRATRDQDDAVARSTARRLANALRRLVDGDDLRRDPDADVARPYAYLLLAACLDRAGDPAAARPAYEVAMATTPRTSDRSASLAALKAYVGQRFDPSAATPISPSAMADEHSVLFEITSALTPRSAA